MNYDNENIFAKILREEIPCDKIYEDDTVLCFRDVNPQAKLHALIIPKKPFVDIADFLEKGEKEYQSHFWVSVNKIIKKLDLTERGFKLKVHKGKDGGQEVFHFHLHLLSDS
tara:strand:+ start:104 stop:439 length:336 start_codon:yes stop_codon:yes gene_type:complete